MRFVLASASPRRHELLKQVVPDFDIDPADIDEDAFTSADPVQTAETLALLKAKSVLVRHPDAVVIGSDTVVALPDGTQFTKPLDEQDAFEILSSLRGRSHWVITGVAVVSATNQLVGYDRTEVLFNPVSDQELRDYIATGEPMDKAGAYGAQGMGSFLVQELRGNFDTVVGLPIELTRRLVTELTQ
ncbi:MAG TPA: Maf family protein [Fimbriimonas sp.]|nr:Maf family protein [Fimbriimonas sp.]